MQIASQDDRRVHFQQILLTLAAAALASSTSIPPYCISSPHTHMPATHPTATTPQPKQRTYFSICPMYIKGYTYNPQPNRPPPRHCCSTVCRALLDIFTATEALTASEVNSKAEFTACWTSWTTAPWHGGCPGGGPRLVGASTKGGWGCHVLSILLGGSVGKGPV